MKNNYLKKLSIFAVLICLIACLFTLVSCGSNNNDGNINIKDLKGTDIVIDGFEHITDDSLGDCLSISLPNVKQVFSLSDIVKINDESKWTLSTDIAGKDVIPSKTVELYSGNNIFYILVIDKDENVKLYTLLIRRKPLYTIIYNYNNGNIKSELIEEGNIATPTNPTKKGYTFTGWSYDFSKPIVSNVNANAIYKANEYIINYDANGGIVKNNNQKVVYDNNVILEVPTKLGYTFIGWYNGEQKISNGNWNIYDDITLIAKWKPSENTKYTINFYKQNIDDENYFLYESIECTATTNSEIIPEVKKYDGFKSPKGIKIKIKADGSSFVNYYYERNIYQITYVDNYGNNDKVEKLKYESELSTLNRKNYNFGGWFSDINQSNEIFKMPAYDTVVYAWWKEETKAKDFIYEYNKDLDSIKINKYIGNAEVVNIPKYINNTEVITIGNRAFSKCQQIKGIHIPSNIVRIEDSAFEYCVNLKKIVIPSSVTEMGKFICNNCGNIKICIETFDTTQNGWDEAWDNYECEIIPSYNNITNNPLFDYVIHDENVYLTKYKGKDKDIIIPNQIDGKNVVCVGTIFSKNTNISSIVLPKELINVCDSAFFNCNNLINIELNNKIKRIFAKAFEGCIALDRISIPYSVCFIGDNAYSLCDKVSNIIVDKKNEFYQSESNCLIDKKTKCLLKGCNDSNIPKDILSIGNNAFSNRDGIKKITIPSNIINIGEASFSSCINLIEIVIEEGVEIIQKNAFQHCTNLTTLYLSKSIKEIGEFSFAGCTKLKNINYSGSKSEWNLIIKGTDWNYFNNDIIVHCTDGDILIK